MSQDVEGSEKCLRPLQVNPNALPHILTSQELIHEHPSLSFPPVQTMGLIPFE